MIVDLPTKKNWKFLSSINKLNALNLHSTIKQRQRIIDEIYVANGIKYQMNAGFSSMKNWTSGDDKFER